VEERWEAAASRRETGETPKEVAWFLEAVMRFERVALMRVLSSWRWSWSEGERSASRWAGMEETSESRDSMAVTTWRATPRTEEGSLEL
jgi:hypothetical protein